MSLKKSEITVEADVTEDEALDFVTHECPACRHVDVFHPSMVAPEGASIWCAECGHDFGPWEELHRQLFTGGAMLDAVLTSRPAPPTD